MTDTSHDRYRDLQRLARAGGRPADELMTLYALEGFLARLVTTRYRDTFVLKGGMLLAALDTRRPTRDIDVQALDFDNDIDHVLEVVGDVLAVDLDDGLTFDLGSVTVEQIRDDDDYHGVRVAIAAALATARLKLKLDISIGDPITPRPEDVDLPRLLDGPSIRMPGLPLPMVLAEKTVTALERGTANTRWRDFADVLLLSRVHDVDGDETARAVAAVSQHRGAELRPLAEVLDGFAEQAQDRWWRWVRKFRLDDRLPEPFAEVLAAVQAFADPVIAGEVSGRRWVAAEERWR